MNDATLLSLVEVPSLRQPGATEARVIIRDMTGRSAIGLAPALPRGEMATDLGLRTGRRGAGRPRAP